MKMKLKAVKGKAGAWMLALGLLPAPGWAFMGDQGFHGMNTNSGYVELDLVSDVANVAPNTDPRLLNAWGVVVGRDAVWVNDNHSGLTTAYSPSGKPLSFAIALPNQSGDPGAPTGLIPNDTGAFVISNAFHHAPATFLMATEDGTLLAWNQAITGTNAVIVADRSGSDLGAVYKGLAVARDAAGAPHIYAANFHAGMVDVFDGQFNYEGSFTDTNLPPNYAPFNIRVLRGKLFVTFAKQLLPDAEDDEAGPGHGYVDIFDTDGTMLRAFAAQGALDSPWGLAIAPVNFGKFSSALLVGNFGDGRINAFDLLTGKSLGSLSDRNGNDIVIEGLWALTFDREEVPGHECLFETQRLYFTAGPGDETHGLFGFLQPISPFRSKEH
jgi:uncharacterized protein (TIGR03118 family)